MHELAMDDQVGVIGTFDAFDFGAVERGQNAGSDANDLKQCWRLFTNIKPMSSKLLTT
jgi:hypothetical protein